MTVKRNVKRLLSLFTCIALSISLISTMAVATESGLHNFKNINTYRKGQFTDVAVGVWYESNVAQVYDLGMMKGDSVTTFNPTGKITQAEALTIAARIHKIYTTGSDDFSDIKQEMQGREPEILEWCNNNESSPAYKEFYSAWYAPYAYYCYTRIWPEGRGEYPQFPALAFDLTFAPFIDSEAPITRERFVSYLIGALPESELSQINTVDNGAIPDINYADNPDVYLLYRAGVLTGNDAVGTFSPASYITRAEVAAIVGRMVEPGLRTNITLTNSEDKNDGSITFSMW